MSAKDLIIDFINFIFIIILIVFCLLYFLVGEHFSNFINILKFFVPVAFFAIFLLVKVNLNRRYKRILEKEGELDKLIYLTFFDKFTSDIIIFFLPIVILVTAYLVKLQVNLDDILQAVFAFIMMYLWQKVIFRNKPL